MVQERLHGGSQEGRLNLVKLSDRNLLKKISLPMLTGEDRKMKKKMKIFYSPRNLRFVIIAGIMIGIMANSIVTLTLKSIP